MAKKSPDDLKKEGVELKAIFAKVKKKPHNCAVLFAKDGIVIETHLKKSPEILLKAAKKAGGMPKGVWGVMTVDGQVVTIDPVNEKVPGSLTKIAKKFFSERGLKNRLEILLPEDGATSESLAPEEEEPAQVAAEALVGEEAEAPDEDADGGDAAKGEGAAGDSEAADPRAALDARLKAAQRDIDALLADTGYDMHPEMAAAFKKYEKAMAEEDFDTATSAFEDMDRYLAQYAEFMEKKGPLVQRFGAMSKGIDAILNGPDSDLAREMKDAISGFDYNLDNSEWFSAGSKIDWMEEQVDALGDSHATKEPPEEPEAHRSGAPAGEESATGNAPEEPEDSHAGKGGAARSAGPSAPAEKATGAPSNAYKAAHDAAKKKLSVYAKLKKVDVSGLKADLASAEKLMKENDPPKEAEALGVISGMEPKFKAISVSYCDRKKKEARGDIDLVKTYLGMALEIPKLEVRFVTLEGECAKDPVNFKEVDSIVREISTKEAQLKKRSKKYKKEHDKIEENITGWCDAWLPDISDPYVSTEQTEIVAEIAVARQKLAENSPKLARKLALKTHFKIKALVDMLKERTTYLDLRRKAELAYLRLDNVRNEGVEEACKGFAADQAKAKAFEDKRAFYDATLLLQPIIDKVPDLLALAADYKAYKTAADGIVKSIISIQKNPQFEFVKPENAELVAKYKAAAALAKKNEIKAATGELQALAPMVTAILAKAEKAKAYKEFEDGLENGDVDDLRKQAVALLADLKAHSRAKLAPVLLKETEKHVLELDSIWNQLVDYSARKELVIISDLANEARAKLDAIDAYYNRADRLGADTAALAKSHAQAAYIRPFLSKIAKLVQKAKAEAIASKAGVANELATGEKWLVAAEETANKQEKYLTHKAEVDAKVTAISGEKVEYEGKEKALVDIAKLLASAEEASKKFNHEAAETALGRVETIVMTANIGVSAKTGTPPSKADIKKLLAQPDGQKSLDDLIASLPDSTQQDVMINVLEARFGMEVHVYKNLKKEDQEKEKQGKALNVPAPNLLEYYEMLKSLPPSHTSLNPSLARFDQVEEDDASWFEPDNDTVVMTVDDAMDSPANPVGDPKQLDDIDPDCVSPAIAKEPTYGSWTTFHEIGHAVDDRQSFMTKNGGNDDYGGWTEYGSNIGPIAKAAADKFEFDRNYIERIMAGGKPKKPEIPADLQKAEGDKAKKVWSKRQKDFEDWHKNVSVKAKPWSSASKVNKYHIDGVMYHEAYSNNWISYKADARKKGLTGYQFRAPGEWFSELYAAYHTKKLSTTHPANSWLATL